MKPYPWVYLSPHLDDAVLSCGGRIWRQVQAGGRVLVVTAFSESPPPGARLSSFARELHTRWESQVEARGAINEHVATRRTEDLAALAYLGAEAAHWPYPDCIYRRSLDGRFLYPGEEALWGDVHPGDRGLIGELIGHLAVVPVAQGGEVYAPLEVSHHVDHQILRRAAEASGQTLTYYEDFPYAESPQAIQAALAETRGESEIVPLPEEALVAKINAIACYRSQVATFWADADHMAAQVRAFARRTGDGQPAERYWKSTWAGNG